MQQSFDVNQLRVAKPCTAAWSEMKGDGKRRFCESCKKNVYNVAGMTEGQVRELVSKSEVLPCMRLSRRADGTVITRDCPVGSRRMYQRFGFAVLGCLAFGFTVVGATIGRERKQWDGETLADHLRNKPIVGPVVDKLFPPQFTALGVPLSVTPLHRTNPFALLPGEQAMVGAPQFAEPIAPELVGEGPAQPLE
jgi:hypothetical protein